METLIDVLTAQKDEQLPHDLYLELGFKFRLGELIFTEWSWRKFRFVKYEREDHHTSVYELGYIKILIESFGNLDAGATYLSILDSKPIRVDTWLTKERLKNIVELFGKKD